MQRPSTSSLTCGAFALLLAGFGAACGGSAEVSANASKRPSSALTSVSVAKVTRQDLTRDLELSAEFRPYQEIDIHAKVSGYLKSIPVDVGDTVKQGQLLAVLEVPEMMQEQAQATASIRRAELEVEKARGEVRRAEIALGIRKLSHDRLAEVVKARPNLVAQQELDDVIARYSDAEAQLAAARANLAASEQQVIVAGANKSRVDAMLSYLRISAPFAGMITQRRGDPGALVQAGTASHTQALPVVRLSQIDRLRLVLPVPESVVPRIRLGTPVEVRVDTLRRVVQGTVARFTGRLNSSTRTMETEVDLPNPNGSIMPGMFGFASLRLDQRLDALAVPVQAVDGHGVAASVMVVGLGGVAEKRKVEAGLETPNLIEIVNGLREGEMVVMTNRNRIKPGSTVEPKLVDGAALRPGH